MFSPSHGLSLNPLSPFVYVRLPDGTGRAVVNLDYNGMVWVLKLQEGDDMYWPDIMDEADESPDASSQLANVQEIHLGKSDGVMFVPCADCFAAGEVVVDDARVKCQTCDGRGQRQVSGAFDVSS